MNEEPSQLERKKILIDLINRETDQIESEMRRPGWTSWALLGALATLAWLLAKELPFKELDWQNVGLIFLTVSLTIDGIRSFASTVSDQDGHPPKEPRFLLSPAFRNVRLYLIVLFIQSSALLYIMVNLKQEVLRIAKISTWIILLFNLISSAVWILFSYCKFPFPRLGRRKLISWALLFPSALMVISLVGYWGTIIKNIRIFNTSEVKISILSVLIAYALILMTEISVPSPLLPALTSIRRDLVLNRIDIDSATKRLDIALSGMQVEDLLQEIVKEILDYIDGIRKYSKELMQRSKAIEEFIPDPSSDLKKPESKRNVEAMKAMSKVNKDLAYTMVDAQGRLEKSIKDLNTRANRIALMDARAVGPIMELEEKIGVAQKEALESLRDANEQSEKVNEKIKAIVDSTS